MSDPAELPFCSMDAARTSPARARKIDGLACALLGLCLFYGVYAVSVAVSPGVAVYAMRRFQLADHSFWRWAMFAPVFVTLPLWPAQQALWSAVLALVAMAALNNHLLLSVLGPLLGVCGAALCCTRNGVVAKVTVVAMGARTVIHEHDADLQVHPQRVPS